MSKLVETVKAARRVSTPLLAVSTADPWATQAEIAAGINGDNPKVTWDSVRGIQPLNPKGRAAIATLGDKDEVARETTNPFAALEAAARLPDDTILFAQGIGMYLSQPVVIQAVSNLRDQFKTTMRTLVMLGTQFSLPPELARDVVLLEDPLPDDAALEAITAAIHKAANLEAPGPAVLRQVVDAVRGLSSFGAEQILAMSLRASGIDLTDAWERKRVAVNQTRGLTLTRGGPTFDELGGLSAAVEFGRRLFGGVKPPRAIVRLDEIEKMLAGATGPLGDSSGVAQDILGAWLRWMEDKGQDGMIAVGPAGTGKTIFSRAMPASFGVPEIAVDIGAMKGSLVGESERSVRDALRVIEGIAQDSAFVVATCNKLESLPPELRRRFQSGIWFFDLPTASERAAIWAINVRRFGIDAAQPLPDDTSWTGAEIRNVCKMAWRLSCTLAEASAYITPVADSDPQGIARLRDVADAGRFRSASYPGPYRKDLVAERRGRAIKLADDPPAPMSVSVAIITSAQEPEPGATTSMVDQVGKIKGES